VRTPPRILIVDDNPTNREIFRTRLAFHGYETVPAGDGEEAIALAQDLAGIAIKAGAGSALATLWPSDDEASAGLVADCYEELPDASLSTAAVLQHAQLKMLSGFRDEHPGVRASFPVRQQRAVV
jgi:CHAT domain-containing protein